MRKDVSFATLTGEAKGLGVLKLTVEQQASFCEELPDMFEPVQGGWGRMGMTYVRLAEVEQDTLLGALETAHRNVSTAAKVSERRRSVAESGASKSSVRAKPKIKV